MGEVPFHKVYMHGLVRDAKGAKMSKSKGNVMNPLDLSEKYGTDALRFTLMALCGQGRDVKLSEQRLEGYRNFSTKLWNAARYCEMNGALPIDNFDPSKVENPINQWIIDETITVTNALDDSMAQYRFNDAANGLYHFIWGTFCDWYLEFTKPLLNEDGGQYVAETKATTGWVLGHIIKILNPFMPYITETLYNELYQTDKLLMLQQWPVADMRFRNINAHNEISWLQRVISEIRSVRTDMNVPASAQLDVLVIGADDQREAWLKTHWGVISKMARVKSYDTISSMPQGAIQVVIGDMTIGLPVADIIDLDKERSRLHDQIKKLEKDIKQIEGKLSNQGFVNNAPADVIEEQKTRKQEAQVIIEKLALALKQLAVA
jgi:valyl-tRNA synthetase